MTTWIIVLINMMLVLSVVSFGMYWWDKRAAQRDKRRVRERTLHTVALLGGWPGALVGRAAFRHKTVKVMFRVLTWLAIVAHVAIAGGVTWLVHQMTRG